MSKARTIQVPVTFGIPKRKADGSVKLEAVTNYEVTTEDYMLMDSYRQSVGYLLFRENEFTQEEVPQEDVETDLGKSMSSQIRDALWVLYRAKGGNGADKEEWNKFYRKHQISFKARILDEVHKIEEGN